MDSQGGNSAIERVCKADMILFIVQVSLIFIVTLFSLINLTFQWGNQHLWVVVLSSCLGYILPNPKLKPEAINRIDLSGS